MIWRFDKRFKIGRYSTFNDEKLPPERRGGMVAYWSLSQIQLRWLMWSPTDIHAFPSEHDKISAKSAILVLEEELERAKEAVLQAQRRVDDLQDNIRHRRAWLAPIRRIPTEILSMVFVLCSEEKWSAALAIQAVCRRWRDIVRATPKPWNFIPWDIALSSPSLREAVPVFLERSSHQPQHINVPHSPPAGLGELLKLYGSQVICLTDLHFLTTMDGLYPNIMTLRLDWDNAYSKVARQDLSTVLERFPHLRILSVYLYETPPSHFLFEPQALMPRLQHLEIRYAFPSEVTGLFKSCAETLRALVLRFPCPQEAEPSDPLLAHFPRLHSVYMHRTGDPDCPAQRVIDASAPLLQNYVYKGRGTVAPIRFDEKLVVHLETDAKLDLSYYSNVEILGIRYSNNAVSQLQQPTTCPRLDTLVILGAPTDLMMEKLKVGLESREARTGKPVRVVQDNSYVFSREIRPFYQCNEGHNCRQRWEDFATDNAIDDEANDAYYEVVESDDEQNSAG